MMNMSTFFSYGDKDFSLSHTLTEQPDPSSFHMHTHANAELYYFVKGRGVFRIEGSEYPLESGDLLVMQPTESHLIVPNPKYPYERKNLHFNAEVLRCIDPNCQLLSSILSRKPGKHNVFKAGDFLGGSCEHYFDAMMSTIGDPRVNIFAGLIPLLNEMHQIHLRRCEEDESDIDTVEYRVIRYINKNLTRPISLDDICDTFYLSKTQLCRLFKDATGTTVWKYITTKRLVRARQLIEAGENPTHIYASQCGFSNYSSFYRAYVKHFGCAPTKNIG